MQMRWGSPWTIVILSPCVRDKIRETFYVKRKRMSLRQPRKKWVKIRSKTRNGKESYSRPEKKTKVWIEGMFCLVMGVVCVPFLHSGRNV